MEVYGIRREIDSIIFKEINGLKGKLIGYYHEVMEVYYKETLQLIKSKLNNDELLDAIFSLPRYVPKKELSLTWSKNAVLEFYNDCAYTGVRQALLENDLQSVYFKLKQRIYLEVQKFKDTNS